MGIKRLPPGVVARIAAGEVVERPASVVKELVENAIDAGARRIVVEVEGGGVELIRVSDDGHGIVSTELSVAFERHATSKIESDAQLGSVETLGFRGEALPSIAAVADVECVTRTESEPHAWRIAVSAERTEQPTPATRTIGTTMTVRELFAELPARRKFLRGRATEGGLIVATCASLALAYPEVAVRVGVDGRTALDAPGDGTLRSAITAVHGRRGGEATVPLVVEEQPRDDVTVDGSVSDGRATLPTRAGMTILVNRRPVQHRSLSFAIDEAYRTVIPVGRHPIAVLDIRVPPDEVDINVHPRKSEVRLRREGAVFAAVLDAVRRTLRGIHPARPVSGIDGALDDLEELPAWAPGVRVLGQVGGTYIIAEGRSGLYLVDQHAAHERVLYESLRAAWREGAAVQPLLAPEVLEIGARQAGLIRDHLEAARSLGYEVELFGDASVLVRSVPAPLAARDPLGTLRAAVANLAEEAPPDDWRDRLAILFACHNAVRAGDRLSEEEMAALLDQLGEAELCHACSHGRPTAILLSHAHLAREFGRPL